MPVDLQVFRWQRPMNGFAWQDAEEWPLTPDAMNAPASERQGRFLVERPMDPRRYQRFNPLVVYPTLFRTFAGLPATEEAYAAFASEHGELGVDVILVGNGPMVTGEPFGRWRVEHMHLSGVVAVLDAIQRKDASALRQWIRVDADSAQYARWDSEGPTLQTIARQGLIREELWDWAVQASSDDETLLRFGKAWAQDQINDALSGKRGQRESLAGARVLLNHEKDDMTLHVVPRSLLAAMWLQCARVLTENPTFKACERCGKWFELSRHVRRKQSKYCSDACKVAAYRIRKNGPRT